MVSSVPGLAEAPPEAAEVPADSTESRQAAEEEKTADVTQNNKTLEIPKHMQMLPISVAVLCFATALGDLPRQEAESLQPTEPASVEPILEESPQDLEKQKDHASEIPLESEGIRAQEES